jgi:hypothetical protein
MKITDYITTIEKAFEGMKKRKESSVIVKYFDKIEQLILPSENTIKTDFAKIIMYLMAHEVCIIKIIYRDNHESLFFMDPEDKRTIVQLLICNNIMPTPEEWSEAKSLANTPGAAAFFGCDFCE